MQQSTYAAFDEEFGFQLKHMQSLEPGEKKEIRGKMYLMKNDINAFLKIYDQEFPSNK